MELLPVYTYKKLMFMMMSGLYCYDDIFCTFQSRLSSNFTKNLVLILSEIIYTFRLFLSSPPNFNTCVEKRSLEVLLAKIKIQKQHQIQDNQNQNELFIRV